MDFPNTVRHKPVISSVSAEAIGASARSLGVTSFASNAWPTANRAIYVPFVVSTLFQVARVWWANGSSVTGNVDCGIYSPGGTLLAATGSTAQSGASVVQSVALSLTLTPGQYYMALALSSTGSIFRTTAVDSAGELQFIGVAHQASAFPLPASATFATAISAYTPLFGITSASVI